MNIIASFLLFLIFFFVSVTDAKAIIVITPVVLIPIVKIVALVIGTLATPVISLSTFYLKLKKKSVLLGFAVGILILIILGVMITLGFKLINPQRPIY